MPDRSAELAPAEGKDLDPLAKRSTALPSSPASLARDPLQRIQTESCLDPAGSSK